MHVPFTKHTDITPLWIERHPESVTWSAPLHNHQTGACVQSGVVQGVCADNRSDANTWYAVNRHCGSYEQHFRMFANKTVFPTKIEALTYSEKQRERIRKTANGWKTTSRGFMEFLSRHNGVFLSSLSEPAAVDALTQRHTLCVQADVRGRNFLFFSDDATGYVHTFDLQAGEFVDSLGAIRDQVCQLLQKRQGLYIFGMVVEHGCQKGVHMLYIYDAFAHNTQSENARERLLFCEKPLVERLSHLQAMMGTFRARDYSQVCLAPFQQVTKRSELRVVMQLYMNSCGFYGVFIRLSSASSPFSR